MKRALRLWRDLSVAKKLYLVVGVMAVLIAVELAILQFAMRTLSAARAFVAGESLWSKAQKDALVSLQRYGLTHQESDYQAFLGHLRIPEGDHLARTYLQSANPDLAKAREGFEQGQIHPDDIGPMITLLTRFHWVSYIRRAIQHWTEADEKLEQIKEVAEHFHRLVTEENPSQATTDRLMVQIQLLNDALTPIEERFSAALGEGSRWLENVVLSLLLIAVLSVESVGLSLTFFTTRSLSKGLSELIHASKRIGQGDFSQAMPIHSRDEIGILSESVNQMGKLLANTYKELEERVRRRTQDLSQLAAENARLYEKSEADVQMREIFLSMASHELRTPFTALFLQLQILSRHIRQPKTPPYDPEVVELVSGTLNHAKRFTVLLDQLLDLTRLQIGKFELQLKPADLSSLVTEVVSQLDTDAASKGAQIRLSAPTPILGMFDEMRMGQVVTNLLSNAIKYGEGKPIDIRVWQEGNRAQLVVCDQGVGIEPEEQTRIFDRFERAADDPHISGLGLGLYIARQIVEAHGGQIGLESTPGAGSTFTVSIEIRSPRLVA